MSSPVQDGAATRHAGESRCDVRDRPVRVRLARVKAVRTQVATTVASAAGPYGYTITLGGSLALASNALGPPHLGDALLMMVGAVAAFVALEAAARGAVDRHGGSDAPPPSPLANAHIPSAGLALCAVWGLVHVGARGHRLGAHRLRRHRRLLRRGRAPARRHRH